MAKGVAAHFLDPGLDQVVCEHHGQGSLSGTACLGALGQKQYEDVPGASVPRLGREDLTWGGVSPHVPAGLSPAV